MEAEIPNGRRAGETNFGCGRRDPNLGNKVSSIENDCRTGEYS